MAADDGGGPMTGTVNHHAVDRQCPLEYLEGQSLAERLTPSTPSGSRPQQPSRPTFVSLSSFFGDLRTFSSNSPPSDSADGDQHRPMGAGAWHA